MKYLFGKNVEIPEEWEIKTFGDIFEFLRTGTNARSDLSGSGDIQYIHYGDIHAKWNSVLDCDFEEIPWIKKDKVEGLSLLKDGDLILADASEDYEGSGSSVLIKNVKNKKIVSGLHTIALRNNDKKISPDFMTYLTSIKFVKTQIISYVTGISVYGLSKNNIRKIRIALPILQEQQKIASILSNVDNLINLTQKEIEHTQSMKNGLMQKLLTKGIGHTKFKKVKWFFGKYVEIPETWNMKNMEDLCKVRQGLQIPISERFNESGPNRLAYITVKTIHSDKFEEFIENAGKRVVCTVDDILFTRTGNTGEIITNVKGVFHNNFFLVDYNRTLLLKNYLIYFLKQKKIQEIIKSFAGSTTIPDLNHGDFYRLLISVPPLEEQQKIASVLSNLDSQVKKQQEYKSKLETLKKGLMQKLLTGQIRVKV